MTIQIFSLSIPLYGLFSVLGVAVAATVGFFFAKSKDVHAFDFICAAVFALLFALVGSKLLFILVTLRPIIEGLKAGTLTVTQLLQGGFVFYGGLLGGAFGLWLYGKCFKTNMQPYYAVFATVLPIGHAFGRVGCYFAGCCYGVEYDGFLSAPYWGEFIDAWGNPTGSGFSPVEQYRLPVQLFEAAFLVGLFVVLTVLFFKKRENNRNAVVYLLSYGLWRFFIEFFRGDSGRGVWLLSTSQWISLCIVLVVVGWLFYQKRRSVPKTQENTDE